MTDNSNRHPLTGIRVIDFSRVLAGPLLAQTLGDLGADVIKVERPEIGDDTRQWGPPWRTVNTEAGFTQRESTYFSSLNRNKRSIVLDLKDDSDIATARRLALSGDIVVDNFKLGYMERIGLNRASLHTERPDIITCTITAYGSDTSAASLPGYDLIAQAMGGPMHLTGEADGRALKLGIPIVDMMTGLNAAIGVLAALHERIVTGVGRHIEVSLFDTALAATLNHQAAALMAGVEPTRQGNRHPSIAPYESYTASDGDFVLAAANNKLFGGFCEVIERPDLINDPRFVNNAARRNHVSELNAEIQPVLFTRTRREWIDRLRAADVPCGPINSIAEAIDWAETMRMRPIVKNGPYTSVRSPIRVDDEVRTPLRRPPMLDEHADEVLAELNAYRSNSTPTGTVNAAVIGTSADAT